MSATQSIPSFDPQAVQRTLERHEALYAELWTKFARSGIPGFETVPNLARGPVAGRTSEVVFVGLNPSFARTAICDQWKEVHGENDELFDAKLRMFRWKARQQMEDRQRIDAAVRAVDEYAREHYGRYYDLIRALAHEADAEGRWQHVDLFPMRNTSQKDVSNSFDVKRKKGAKEWQSAVSDMFEAAIELIEALQPKVVVVLNAHASRTLEAWLPLELKANQHRHEAARAQEPTRRRLRGVPFLLGSQLSGGATSTYARLRLAADLRDALAGGQGFRSRRVPVAGRRSEILDARQIDYSECLNARPHRLGIDQHRT